MSDIKGVNNSALFDELGLGSRKKDEGSKELGQADFLKLLVAQMKNQDPLKPQENGDFMAQMAQFSQTDGIQKMQKSLENLASSLQSNQALQASALVGRSVMVPGSTGYLQDEGALKGMADLKASATDIRLQVFSSNGVMIREQALGNHQAGEMPFSWDGLNNQGERMTPGSYDMKIFAKVAGLEEQVGTHIAANVNSVTLGRNGEGVKLNVAGLGQVNLDDVNQISE